MTLPAAGLAVATAGILLLDEQRGGLSGVEAPVPVVAALPVSGDGKSDARMAAAAVEAMRRRPDNDLSSLPAFVVPPPLRSIDGTAFSHGDETVRLAGVEGPGPGDVCLDGEIRWSCGLQARAALHNLVAGRALTCQPRRAMPDGTTLADCSLADGGSLPQGDLAHLLVARGWARPLADAEAAFHAERAGAVADGAGLWRGGWRFVRLNP
jgi:endonuclease YncB( thermonuclease family)